MPSTATSISLAKSETPVAKSRKAQADAGLNLAVYGVAAVICGVSAVAACAVLFGWAAWRKRSASRRAGDATLNLGGPFQTTSALAVLVIAALGAAVLLAPEMPIYATPITMEVLPPPAG